MKSRPFNDLTLAESERLALLIEECGEVIQAASKVLRHGYTTEHPSTGVNNLKALTQEIGDALAAIQLMTDSADVHSAEIIEMKQAKLLRVFEYMHHQPKWLRALYILKSGG